MRTKREGECEVDKDTGCPDAIHTDVMRTLPYAAPNTTNGSD